MIKSPYHAGRLNVGCKPREVANRMHALLLNRRTGGGPFVLGVVSTPRGLQWAMCRGITELAEKIQLDTESHLGTYTLASTAKDIREDVEDWAKSMRRAA